MACFFAGGCFSNPASARGRFVPGTTASRKGEFVALGRLPSGTRLLAMAALRGDVCGAGGCGGGSSVAIKQQRRSEYWAGIGLSTRDLSRREADLAQAAMT